MGAKANKMPKAQADLVPNQLKNLPITLTVEDCKGKTYIVTGGNGGLGYEAAKHLVRLEAAKVIISVRNAEAGKAAKSTIEAELNRKDVIEVWDLDLASYDSVKAFAKKVESLERIDALVLNAGALISAWDVKEGSESNITINVVSNFLLAVSVLPHLKTIAKQHEIQPRLVFVGSVSGILAGEQQAKKLAKTNIFDDLDDQAKWKRDMPDRYALSKYLEHAAMRELAALVPASESGVVINVVDPGLCKTNLTRNLGLADRIKGWLFKVAIGRTPEMGSRTLLHGIAAEESHGKYLTACEVREDHIPEWMTDESGTVQQKQIWTDLAERLDKVQPGVVAAAIQN